MTPRVALPTLEAVGAAAALRRRAGDRSPLLGALVEVLAPARVLEVGSSAGEGAARMLETARGLGTLLTIDPSADSVSRAAARIAGAGHRAVRPPAIAVHHARLLGEPRATPHLTRVPALVEALRGPGFDLITVEPPPTAAALHLVLSQVVPLLGPDGLCLVPLEGCPGAVEVVRRVVEECGGPAMVWQPEEKGAPGAALLGVRRPRHNHEDARDWCAAQLAADPAVGAARAGGDHAAVCGALRHWLARRLVWSTRDLLLPLAELPPALSVRDVVDLCARGEGGVWGYGAAVTLAMLYRACGYPATVYQHGVPDLYRHMLALVQVPDGRILVEDAFFDAELRVGERPVDWREALTIVHAGRVDLLRFASELGGERLHLYSRASLAAAESDGYLTPAERRTLERAMEGCRRVVGDSRALLRQPATASLAAFTRIAVHARALAAVRSRTGIAEPLALLGLPCGTLPLSGDARLDHDVVRTLEEWERLAQALAPAEAVGA